ncbi:MAG: cytochrome c [Bacteroidetes bacterium]|nr:cytochrome c [Bacteroidota bacterium]
MYTGLLHTHKLVVVLFLLHYVVKLVLLLLNRNEQLANYSKRTKVTEMAISALFLITGLWMMGTSIMKGGSVSTLQIIKLVCVFSSIPLAIIGFKRSNKLLAVLAVLLIIAAYGLAEVNKKKKAGGAVNTETAGSTLEAGKLVYQDKCMQCHGSDGAAGISGAKALGQTSLTADEQKAIVKSGKNSMPAFGETITEEQTMAVIEYVATFKQ